jgi:hypothetical protein
MTTEALDVGQYRALRDEIARAVLALTAVDEIGVTANMDVGSRLFADAVMPIVARELAARDAGRIATRFYRRDPGRRAATVLGEEGQQQ